MTDQQFWAAAFLITVKFPDQFRPKFADWLYDNVHLQRAFEAEALKVAALGRKHYSAHTIIEYMRHNTTLTSKNDDFKINEAWTSSMSRLFAHMNPQHHTLFEFRVRPGDAVVGPMSFV